jgi:hypothetical protein
MHNNLPASDLPIETYDKDLPFEEAVVLSSSSSGTGTSTSISTGISTSTGTGPGLGDSDSDSELSIVSSSRYLGLDKDW